MGLRKEGYLFSRNLDSHNYEIHIHKARYDDSFQKGDYNKKSICNKHDVDKHGNEIMATRDIRGTVQKFFNEHEARAYAADLQNSGEEVCGICVSHLYYSDESY